MHPSGRAILLRRYFWPVYPGLSRSTAMFTLAAGVFAVGPLHVDDIRLAVIPGLGGFGPLRAWWHAGAVRRAQRPASDAEQGIG